MAAPSAEDVDAYNTAAYLRITSIAIAAYRRAHLTNAD